jgi:hypothetical protein
MRWGVKARAFRYPVATIAARLVSGEALGEVAPRRAWSLWFRGPGGRLRRRSRS